MNPTQLLITEHRLIERAVSQIEDNLKARQGNNSSLGLTQFIDFLSSYADLCHHGKEENILFLECESRKLPKDLSHSMAGLTLEHIGFRKMREKMSILNLELGRGNLSNLAKLNELIKDFHVTLKRHVDKEESIFFPRAINLFDQEEKKEMLKRFHEFDQAIMHEKYRQLVDALEKGESKGGCL